MVLFSLLATAECLRAGFGMSCHARRSLPVFDQIFAASILILVISRSEKLRHIRMLTRLRLESNYSFWDASSPWKEEMLVGYMLLFRDLLQGYWNGYSVNWHCQAQCMWLGYISQIAF